MRLTDSFVAELEMEGATTRRVLERVPNAHLTWKPHQKSSSLGQLALHVATIPKRLSEFVAGESFDFATANTGQPLPASREEILAAFDESQTAARAYLTSLDETRVAETWTLMARGKGLLSLPR